MPTEVHMIYTGIVNFATAKTGRGVHVVVQNARYHPAAKHLPWIVVAANDGATPGHKATGLREIPGKPKIGLTAYELDGVEIDIDNEFSDPTTPLRVEPSFDRYVLASGEAFPDEVVDFDRALLTVQDPSRIAARSLLSRGNLCASWVDPTMQWQYDHLKGRHLWLAQEICHYFEIEEDFLRLRLEDLYGTHQLEVYPHSPGKIEVMIGNTLRSDIPTSGTPSPKGKTDPHVKLYYEMACEPVPAGQRHGMTGRDAKPPLEHPPQKDHDTHSLKPKSSGTTTASVTGANCPPNNWNG